MIITENEKVPLLNDINLAVYGQKRLNLNEKQYLTKMRRTSPIGEVSKVVDKNFIYSQVVKQSALDKISIIICKIIDDNPYRMELLLTTPIISLNLYHDQLHCNNMNLFVLEMIKIIVPQGQYVHTIPSSSYGQNCYLIYLSQSRYVVTDTCCRLLCCSKKSYYCFCDVSLMNPTCCCGM